MQVPPFNRSEIIKRMMQLVPPSSS
ncbi:MAG: hypothetical protein QG591_2133, partial [Planctomycetota bacterium]|nr:hypothetical protein [Planctomycetota bacterium]